jgi:hypothetical protein
MMSAALLVLEVASTLAGLSSLICAWGSISSKISHCRR